MGAAAIPLLIGGGLLQANSQWQQGQNASRGATVAAGQLEENARRATYAAGQEKAASQRKSAEELRQNRLIQSKQIAIAAAGGASTSSKNIADIISNTAKEGEYASLSALYSGDIRSDSLLNEAMNLRNKAAITRYEGKQARKAGNIGAASSLLMSGAQAGSLYGQYGQKAPLDPALSTDSYYNSPNYGRRGAYDSYYSRPPQNPYL